MDVLFLVSSNSIKVSEVQHTSNKKDKKSQVSAGTNTGSLYQQKKKKTECIY